MKHENTMILGGVTKAENEDINLAPDHVKITTPWDKPQQFIISIRQPYSTLKGSYGTSAQKMHSYINPRVIRGIDHSARGSPSTERRHSSVYKLSKCMTANTEILCGAIVGVSFWDAKNAIPIKGLRRQRTMELYVQYAHLYLPA